MDSIVVSLIGEVKCNIPLSCKGPTSKHTHFFKIKHYWNIILQRMWSKNAHIKKDDQLTLGRDKWNNTKRMKSSESSEMNPQFLGSSEMNIIL